MSNTVIVKAFGWQLDELRSEACRLSQDKVDWVLVPPDDEPLFTFHDDRSKAQFVSFCKRLGVTCRDA